MRRLWLFCLGVSVQASFGLGTLLVIREGFRSWPQGSYTWIPILATLAGFIWVLLLARFLSAKGLPFGITVAAWYFGRIAGAFAGAALPGVGLDASLLETASFGALTFGRGRLALSFPSLVTALLPIAILAVGHAWGKRASALQP